MSGQTIAPFKTRSVPSLERALKILEMLAHSKKGMALPEIARELGLPKSSTHCLLLTLERCGYLQRHAAAREYLFGFKLFSLANLSLAGTGLREQAAPYLQALMAKTRLTVHLAILEKEDAVLIDKIECPGLLRLSTWIGKRMDLHCTGVGKVLMAHLPEDELIRLINDYGLPRHNENTIGSMRKLKEDLKGIRQMGYSIDDEEDSIGLRCIGVPVWGQEGQVIAAFSLAGTTTQITPENLSGLMTQMKHTSLAISNKMGFFPS